MTNKKKKKFKPLKWWNNLGKVEKYWLIDIGLLIVIVLMEIIMVFQGCGK